MLEQKDGWTKLESGELTGWANNDYLLFGEEARKEAKDAGRIVATTKTGALRIRKEPSGDAAIYDLLEEGAKYEVVDEEQIRFSEDQEITADWVAINYGGKTGYVSSEYVQVDFEIDYGETVEQVKAREAETARLQAEKEVAAQKQKKEKAAQAEKEANKVCCTGCGRQRAFGGAHSVKRRRALRRTGSCRRSRDESGQKRRLSEYG